MFCLIIFKDNATVENLSMFGGLPFMKCKLNDEILRCDGGYIAPATLKQQTLLWEQEGPFIISNTQACGSAGSVRKELPALGRDQPCRSFLYRQHIMGGSGRRNTFTCWEGSGGMCFNLWGHDPHYHKSFKWPGRLELPADRKMQRRYHPSRSFQEITGNI